MFMSTSFFISRGCLCAFLMLCAGHCLPAAGHSVIPHESSERESVVSCDTSVFALDEVTIHAGVKNARTSPLRLKSVDASEIEVKASGKTFPELLKDIPGIYATDETGSYGDAKINIRGFKQENISVLLNGIPISGLTTGNMFWNNWLGLTDATAMIQVQKGIGGSMLSDNSVGGTINIITKSPSARPSAQMGYSYTGYGMSKVHLGWNSGELKKGWAVSLIGSYTWGSSYIDCSDISSGAYMLSVSKKAGKKHSFLFTALGGPERHQQRSQRINFAEMEKYGIGYNKNWGYYTGPDGKTEKRTISENNYFKPYFTLSHFYTANERLSVNSSIYLTIGNGGGIWTESKGKRIISFQKDGQIDWNAVIKENRNSATEVQTPEGSAKNIISDYMAGHTQFGATSAMTYRMSDRWTLEGGIHYQHYRTWEKEQITDLLGGEYWYENYESGSLAGIAGRNPYKKVGDFVRTDNGKNLHFGTLYATFNYKGDKWIFNMGASFNGSLHQRWDRYNYTGDGIKSEIAAGAGTGIKAGALFNADKKSSFYLNGAFYSRAPYTNVFFASGNNRISEDVKNEQNILGEFGFRHVYGKGGVEATVYAAYWMNKSLMSNAYKPLEEDAYKFMITGLNAVHYGIELDAFHNFTRWLKAEAYASIGSWKWKNDVRATIYDNYTGQVAQQIAVYSDGLPVGDAPQTKISARIDIRPFSWAPDKLYRWLGEFTVSADWQYNSRHWADFEPSARTNPDDRTYPFRIPDYNLVNFCIRNTFRTGFMDIMLFFNMNNLLDESYITRGKDGSDHTADTFAGYWGAGRNCNFGARLTF